MKYKTASKSKKKTNFVFEDLIDYVAVSKNSQKIKPVFKTDDFVLYNNNCLDVLKRFPDNYADMILRIYPAACCGEPLSRHPARSRRVDKFIDSATEFTLHEAAGRRMTTDTAQLAVRRFIFADPPYLLSNDGFSCQNGKRVSVNKGRWDSSKGFDEDLNFHDSWIKECRRVLKPEGTIWISGTYHSIYKCGFLLQKHNFHLLNDISWFKPNASPNLSCRFFTASHETVLWARKDKKAKHYFDYISMKNGKFPEDKIKKPSLQMRSVWSIPTLSKDEKIFGKHPTQKPLMAAALLG